MAKSNPGKKGKQVEGDTKVIDGVRFRAKTPDMICLLWLFRSAPILDKDPLYRQGGFLPADTPYCGTGRHRYSRLISEIQRPSFQWSDWSIKADEAFCSHDRNALVGGGGSSKSYTAGDYALKFWQCAPNNTSVVIVSTSMEAAKKRIWKSISTGYMEITRRCGRIGESAMLNSPRALIRSRANDAINGIYVVPVEEGDIEKAVNAIKGYHNTRVLIIRDESDSVSEATYEVESNLRIGTEEFQTIDIGNHPSSLNLLGKQMEVFPGKPITESLGYEWTSYRGVHCMRFDGEDSPNIRQNTKKWTGLMTEEDRADIEKRAGGKNTRTYYVMVKGLPPPEGVDDTVVSEPLLHAHNAFDHVTWLSGYIISASLDPGFGGDKCCYRTFKRGMDKDGKFRAHCEEIIEIPITTGDSSNPPEYQIAAKVKEWSVARGVRPEEFIAGTTGIGRGVGSTLQREWSPNINLCEEGGAPSDLPVSDEDPRPAKELYDRRVTELAFCIREFIQAGILRGLDEKTAIQLCQRKWEFKGRKKAIQKKDELPSSPNEMDALAFYIELLRRKGINASVQTPVKRAATVSLHKEAQEQDFDSGEVYADPMEDAALMVGCVEEWD